MLISVNHEENDQVEKPQIQQHKNDEIRSKIMWKYNIPIQTDQFHYIEDK